VKYHQAADLFVLPSLAFEGFGLVTLEALACGTPAVGTPIGATPEILRPLAPQLLLGGTEPPAIRRGIQVMLEWNSDAAAKEELRRRCREYAETTYGWDRAVDSLERLFSDLVGRASKILWLLMRSRAMTPAEIGLRAAREVRNSVHRLTRGRGRKIAPPLSSVLPRAVLAGGGPSAEELLETRRERILALPANDEEMARSLAAIGVTAGEITVAADRILAGSIPAYGFSALEVGNAPDWNRDPETGRQWPMSFWTDVDYRFAEGLGDPRHVWELNRHHHLVTLGRAYRLTRDSRYATAVWNHIRSWIDANPPYHGVNWTSALELGIRLISWGMALDLVGLAGVREGDAGKLLVSVSLQANHICDNLSIYASSKNNHLIGEAAGLFAIGTALPFLSGASRWARKGRALLERDVPVQVTSDGVCREQTLHYQAFVLEFCLTVLAVGRASGEPLSPALEELAGRMGVFLERTGGPGWTPPAIGDEDGGRAYDLSDVRGRQCARAAACAALAAGRPVPRLLREPDLEPALWLFGPEAVLAWLDTRESSRGERDEGTASAAFPEGGYFVPASATQHGVIDCGPLGYPSIAAHGHADCLSLSIAVEGEWVLVDPGTFCYHRDRLWRDHFRSTRAHNTVTVDRTDQSEMLGPFIWGRRARPEQVRWATGRHFDLFEGAHDGYVRRLGVRHRRTVVFGKLGYWIVVDVLEGKGSHEVGATLQLPAGYEAVDGEPLTFAGGDGSGIAFRTWLPPGLAIEIESGREDPPAGWVSPVFGTKVPAPAVAIGGSVTLPATIVTAIVPFSGADGAGADRVAVDCRTGGWRRGAVVEAVAGQRRDLCLLGAPPQDPDAGLFEGALGLVVERNGRREAYGVDVKNWTERERTVERTVEFESVPNRLANDFE